ncbi:MAG: DUF512 domain-containing protein [Chloroflexia bacterium]|nr:DUF512 domain-containing protein [Chloroflexia bacterium]
MRDDDYRLSFLYGNFVTLTNLRPADWDRLDEQHLSPLYVSVHATDPVLRRILLGRSDLPDIRAQLLRLEQLAIEVHAQIVLCPGINDGEYLQQTLSDLEERSRSVVSVALVPVGLTRFRNERSVVLPGETAHLRSYTPTEAREMLSWAGPLQRSFRQRWGRNLLYLSDEFYLLAGRSVPAARFYDDFPQLENGVGLVRLLREDWFRARRRLPAKLPRPLRMSLVCGTMIAPMLREFARECQERTELLTIEVLALENQTFGPLVTVSGLLTGECLRAGLRGRTLGDVVVMPRVAFEQSGRCTLDEVSLSDLAAELQCPLLLADQMSEVVEALNQIDRGNPPSPLFTDLRYPTF